LVAFFSNKILKQAFSYKEIHTTINGHIYSLDPPEIVEK